MSPKKKHKKTFILDSNVILHDSSCIHHFAGHDIVIPITVLEELGDFNQGKLSLNSHAREFLRSLDALRANKLFNGGVRSIGAGKGRISIKLEHSLNQDVQYHRPCFHWRWASNRPSLP